MSQPKIRVYLDNCCFNRPFDDQKQIRVRIEAEAKLCVQDHIRSGGLELIWSYILDFENNANPFIERKATISAWKQYAIIDIEESHPLLQAAHVFTGLGLKTKDALHIACAIAGKGAYFMTTDNGILKRANNVNELTIIDPTSFVRETNL